MLVHRSQAEMREIKQAYMRVHGEGAAQLQSAREPALILRHHAVEYSNRFRV
jgi:hypothetical protein